MATNQVPGANPANKDSLHGDCWAEHDDGSLIYVYDMDEENNRVIYSLFDPNTDPITEARDAMPVDEFKKFYSWTPNSKKEKWLWHDKSKFPWDRIIKQGARDGLMHASAMDQLSAAARTAEALGITSKVFNPEFVDHLREKESPRRIMDNIQNAINDLPVKKQKKAKKLMNKLEKTIHG